MEVRRWIRDSLVRWGLNAILLEDEEPVPRQTHFARLLALIERQDVRHFLVFWPLGARLHGLEVEFGHLLTRILEGDLSEDRVHLLVEVRPSDHEPIGETRAISEPGNRTRYHDDLLAAGCPIWLWADRTELERNLRAVAFEILSRSS